MLFIIKNTKRKRPEQFKAEILLSAYFIIKNYPINASEKILDQFVQNKYGTSLKNLCIQLLLNLTFFVDESGRLILLFKDPKNDMTAQLITYGNGVIRGSNILKLALTN